MRYNTSAVEEDDDDGDDDDDDFQLAGYLHFSARAGFVFVIYYCDCARAPPRGHFCARPSPL